MPFDALVLSIAVTVFIGFAGVLAWADRPGRRSRMRKTFRTLVGLVSSEHPPSPR
jgi:hypothetical protein